jgi:hypothetical protein
LDGFPLWAVDLKEKKKSEDWFQLMKTVLKMGWANAQSEERVEMIEESETVDFEKKLFLKVVDYAALTIHLVDWLPFELDRQSFHPFHNYYLASILE